MSQTPPLRLFISYSHKDDNFRHELETHLATLRRQGVITVRSDRQTEAGAEWEQTIREELETADIILLLVGPDFLASDFCHGQELKRAMERHETRAARVIPVFLRHCDWKGETFGKLQGVPDNAKPVAAWSDRDKAYTIVAGAIRTAAQSLRLPRARFDGRYSTPGPRPGDGLRDHPVAPTLGPQESQYYTPGRRDSRMPNNIPGIAAKQRIFIGHGRSPLWRELKDFIQDRLRLPWEEFNREPAAGYTTSEGFTLCCLAWIMHRGGRV